MADCSNDASTSATFSGKFHDLSDIIIGSPVRWDFFFLGKPIVDG